MDPAVFHVYPRGRLANRMIQYMVALAFADRVPGCRIAGVSLPQWGIDHPDMPGTDRLRVYASEQHLPLATLADQVLSGEYPGGVSWPGFGQRMENFLPRERYRTTFVSPFSQPMGYGPDCIVCPVRAEDILLGATPDYPLTPVEFYRDVVAMTRLRPVFIGQTEPNAYLDRLRAAFPTAIFRAPQSDPLFDFETIRQSHHAVVGVSTFSWLAAWLSDTMQTIHLTVSGLFHPRQRPSVDLLPYDDPRYRFHLFPINYAVTLDRHAELHRRIAPYWHLQPAPLLRQQLTEAPRFGWNLDDGLAVFDEAYYLAANADVAAYAEREGRGFARAHYIAFGFRERRLPVQVEHTWYATRYPLAAYEVGRGDYAGFEHHYMTVGRLRGYQPMQVAGEW